jgi:iron complex outermembrane receptor protein
VYGSVIYNPPGRKIADQSTLTNELQIQGSSFGNKLTWQAGGYLEHGDPLSTLSTRSANLLNCADLNAFQCTDVLGAALGFPLGRIETTESRTWYRDYGLYAQATYSLTERLKLTGGFRYTWDSQRSEVSRVARLFIPSQRDVCVDTLSTLPACFFAPPTAKSSRPTWLIDLDYKPNEDILLYAKYARGYRAGGVLPSAPRGNQSFEPEKLDAYEIGLKASFSGAVRGNFNVAGFYNDFTNQQLRAGFRNVVTQSQVTGIANAGTSRMYGIEVEATVNPFEGFALDASYAYLNTKITKINPIVPADPANYAVSISIPLNAPLFYAPENKLSLTARYTLPLDNSIGDVTLGATYSFTDKQLGSYAYYNPATLALFNGNDYGTVPSFAILNLNLNWKSVAGLPVDVSAFATNVTAKKYFAGVAGVGSAFGFESYAVGEPRTFGLRVRYRFGD